jgi:hypothetical protein
MKPSQAVLALFWLSFCVQLCEFSTANAQPVFRIPLIADDTDIDGLCASLLATFLAEVMNFEGSHPFKVEIDTHFVYTAGPEGFYEANKISNLTRPPILMGPEYSSPVQLVSTIGDVYEVPTMVYWATSPYLSSKDEYPYIWRTMVSDAIRISVWVELCLHYQWAHAVVIEEASLYGRGASENFEILAAEKGIRTWRLKLNSAVDIPLIFSQLEYLKAKIIVAPLTTLLLPMMEKAVEAGFLGPGTGYVWLMADSVSRIANRFVPAFSGSISSVEPNEELLATYDLPAYHRLIDVAYAKVNASYNTVMVENNPFRVGAPPRASLAGARPLLFQAGSLPTSLARALITVCEASHSFYTQYQRFPNASEMITQLKQFSRPILGETVQFNSQQEMSSTTIDIVNIRNGDPFHIVGKWRPSERIQMQPGDEMVWPDGTTKVPDDGIALESYHRRKGALGAITITFAVILCLIFLLTLMVTVKFANTPVFRLASPYSLIIILVGLFCLTLGAIFYVDRPSKALCQLRVWFYYVGLTTIYSALIAKTWRVWMVFRESNSLKRGIVITNVRLMIYTGLLMAPAILFTTLRSTVGAEYGQRVLSTDKKRVDVVCKTTHKYWTYIQQAYAGIQMIVLCYFSWKTRKVPTGFNESWHVFTSVYIVCTIGMIGLISSAAMEASFPSLSIGFLIFSTFIVSCVMWGLLFIPKLYIALLDTEQNTPELMKAKEKSSRFELSQVQPSQDDSNQVSLLDSIQESSSHDQ